jgi:N6-adenosine-specific RNA methylase IME4
MNNELPTTPGGWPVLYADPAWKYSNGGTRAAAKKNYAVMTLEEMKALPVSAIAAEDCALFMWSTCPMQKTAFDLAEAWGFRYKTIAFWWAKRNRVSNSAFFGMGNWTRANGEPVLLFTRGSPRRRSAKVSQFVWAPIARHSEKPAEVRNRIATLMGDVPRLELFSRHEVPGWARWGNQILA